MVFIVVVAVVDILAVEAFVVELTVVAAGLGPQLLNIVAISNNPDINNEMLRCFISCPSLRQLAHSRGLHAFYTLDR